MSMNFTRVSAATVRSSFSDGIPKSAMLGLICAVIALMSAARSIGSSVFNSLILSSGPSSCASLAFQWNVGRGVFATGAGCCPLNITTIEAKNAIAKNADFIGRILRPLHTPTICSLLRIDVSSCVRREQAWARFRLRQKETPNAACTLRSMASFRAMVSSFGAPGHRLLYSNGLRGNHGGYGGGQGRGCPSEDRRPTRSPPEIESLHRIHVVRPSQVNPAPEACSPVGDGGHRARRRPAHRPGFHF